MHCKNSIRASSMTVLKLNYNEIESNSVGYKEDYEMHSLDFEEFLWAKGYSEEQVEEFISDIVKPVLEENKDVLGLTAEINV